MTKEDYRLAILAGVTSTNVEFMTVERPHLMAALAGDDPADPDQAAARSELLKLENETPGQMYLTAPRLKLVAALSAPTPDAVEPTPPPVTPETNDESNDSPAIDEV